MIDHTDAYYIKTLVPGLDIRTVVDAIQECYEGCVSGFFQVRVTDSFGVLAVEFQRYHSDDDEIIEINFPSDGFTPENAITQLAREFDESSDEAPFGFTIANCLRGENTTFSTSGTFFDSKGSPVYGVDAD